MYILQCHDDQSGDWYEFSESGEMLSHHTLSTIADSPQVDTSADLTILLPGDMVRMTHVTLPKMRRSEQLRAIPFALETQLACDPDQVDMALGDANPDGSLTVAIFDKAKFKAEQQLWQDQGLSPSAVLPDYLSIVHEENTWTLYATHKTILVRTGFQSGFAADADSIYLLLKLALDAAAGDSKLPKKITCYQKGGILDPQRLENLNVSVVYHDILHQAIVDPALLHKQPAINLLQGKYQPRHQLSLHQRKWRLAAISVAVWLVILFGAQITQWIFYAYQENKLSKQILTTYQAIFPGSTTVSEPRFRVNTLLKQLKTVEKSDAFLRVLSTAGDALNQYPSVFLEKVSFSNDKLTFQIKAKNLGLLGQLTDAMRKAGLQVKQEVGKTDGKAVIANLVIQEVV